MTHRSTLCNCQEFFCLLAYIAFQRGARQARWQALAGKGGEHNAPLRRAVIGGLIFATIAAPVFGSAILRMVRDKRQPKAAEAGGELSAT
jgi:hypothetical protein